MFNLMIAGAAGQGIDTTSAVFERFLKDYGYNVFATRDLMSRVRGGYNFTTLRISTDRVITHDHEVDGILALNQQAVTDGVERLRPDGFVLADESFKSDDERVISLPMQSIAKELGNPRVASSVALGALMRLFDFPKEEIEPTMAKTMKPSILELNVKAAQEGYELVDDEMGAYTRRLLKEEVEAEMKEKAEEDNSIEDKNAGYLEKESKDRYKDWLVMNGNQAIGLGALAAGMNFYAAYPMSPSTSVMEYLASVMEEANIVVEQAEDELAGINMAIGASYAGAVAMTGTSGGGFALKVEALAMSGMAEIPVVVVNAMRPGPVTGLPTRTEQADLNMAIFAGNGEYPKMVIAVKNHEDAFYQSARAHLMAQKYQIPVILLTDQYLADGTATIPPFDYDRVERVVISASPEDALAYEQGYERSDMQTGEIAESALAKGEYKRYRNTESGISPRLIPGNPYAFVSADTDEHDEYGFITEAADVRVQQVDKRRRKTQTLINEDLQEPELYGDENADICLLAWGSLEGAVKEAVNRLTREDGLSVKALIFGDVWPLPTKNLESIAKDKSQKIINVEQNQDGQLGCLVRRETGIGMDDSVLKYDGRPISAKEIQFAIREKLQA